MKRIAYFFLAATFVYPGLLILYALSPNQAIRLYQGMIQTAKVTSIGGAVGFCVLAIIYPPFLEHFRRFRQRIRRRMTADWNEIKRLEKRMKSSETPGLAFKLGNAYFQIEDYPKAVDFFEQALKLEKKSDLPVSTEYRLGVAYLQLGQPEKALPMLRTVYDREPSHASGEVQLYLADACRLKGDLVSARKFYESFEKHSGGVPQLHYQFGLLIDFEGNRADARERMKQALESYRRLPLHLRRFHKLPVAKARWFLLTRW